MTLNHSDYPALFRAADRASVAAQSNYLRFTRATLTLLVAGAGLAAVAGAFEFARAAFAITSAAVLATSLVLTTYLKMSNLEKVWYGGRAVAESVKSMTWRYATGSDPYAVDFSPAEVDGKFLAQLESILKERKQLAYGFGGEASTEPQISDRMRQIRAGSPQERKAIYLSERISDQRRWYGDRARSNRSAGNAYFIFIAMSQLLALITAIALVHWPASSVKLTGLFTSLAATLIAWLEIRQHKGLAQSYSIAELELGFIQEKAKYVDSNRTLSDFVGDAENAISREHTLWVARRDRN